MEGTPYWRERTPVMSSSVMKPSLVRQLPSLPPLERWNSRAFWSWSCVIKLSLTSISPRRTDIRSTPLRACTQGRSEEHTSELQSHVNLVCRLLLEKKKVYVT